MTIEVSRGSEEFVRATVTVTEGGDLGDDVIPEISITHGSVYDWRPAIWTDAVGTTRTARTAETVEFDDTFTGSRYRVHVRLTDDPEAPIIYAGELIVTT